MATWKAKCWLGSDNGYQDLTVESNTFHGAEEQLKRIYGAEQIINLKEVRQGSSSSSSSSVSGLGGLIVVGLIIGAFAMFNGEGNNKPQPNVTSTAPIQPVQTYSNSEVNGCKIWANANPTLAAKLTTGDRCFGKI